MLKRFLIYIVIILTTSSTLSFAQKWDRDRPTASFVPEWDRATARLSLINPHEQIDDAGDILWNKCLICHPEVPDIKKAKSIADVKIRFEEDMKMLCYRCHPEVMHPGGAWFGSMKRDPYRGAPNHWIKPPDYIAKNIEISLKETPTLMLPLEPKTGKIFCATCHNPHEKGLLIGKADTGADSDRRLRSGGAAICQYCHRR